MLPASMTARLQEGPQDDRVDSPEHTANRVCVPGHSAVLIMEAPPWRTPSVNGRASAEAFMAAGSMEAGGEGSSPSLFTKDTTKCIYGGKQSCTAPIKPLQ